MAGVQVKIRTDRIADAAEEMSAAAKRALEAAGLQAEAYAKLELENDPRRIDTGLLRNSITHAHGGESPAILSYEGDRASRYGGSQEIPSGSYSGVAPDDSRQERTVYIGTNVNYGIYVHEGAALPSGKKMEPNHFLRNAIEKNVETLKNIIEKNLHG